MLFFYLILATFVFSIWTQKQVKDNFDTYSKQITKGGQTGAEVARKILHREGIYNVTVERTDGTLTDHYDPKDQTIRLSKSVYDSASVAAVGVAAHECGHALQYAKGYAPARMRTGIVPLTSIGSRFSMPLILAGMIFSISGLIDIGVMLFALVVIFQLVTLPVEFNASGRALGVLADSHMLTEEELPASKKVLTTAAMTYVAALAVSMTQFFRLLTMSRRRR